MYEKNIWILFIATYFSSSIFFLKNDLRRFTERHIAILFELTIGQILINSLVIFPFFIAIPQFFHINVFRNTLDFPRFPLEIIINYYIYDFIKYYLHKFFHRPFFYKLFHKKRHQIYNPIGFTIFYSHPIDFIVMDLIPIYAGLFLMKAHIFTYYFFVFTETYLSVLYNSGIGSRHIFYDFHNKYMDCNYGSDMIMDKFFETYFTFKEE